MIDHPVSSRSSMYACIVHCMYARLALLSCMTRRFNARVRLIAVLYGCWQIPSSEVSSSPRAATSLVVCSSSDLNCEFSKHILLFPQLAYLFRPQSYICVYISAYKHVYILSIQQRQTTFPSTPTYCTNAPPSTAITLLVTYPHPPSHPTVLATSSGVPNLPNGIRFANASFSPGSIAVPVISAGAMPFTVMLH